MKNFSLKALGATFIAAALVLISMVAPAQAAANISMVTSPAPTFIASSNSPAFTITIDNNTTFVADQSPQAVQLQFDVRSNSGSGGIWFPVNTCETTYVNVSASHCGIASVTATSGLGTPQVYNDFGILKFKGLGTATAITIAFDGGAFTTAAGTGLFNMRAVTGNTNNVSYQLQITVTSAPVSVGANWLPNGGSGTSMTPTSSSTGSIVMPTPTYSKTGFTFAGWRAGSANSGTVYQVGETAPLLTLTSFYAQWSDNSATASTSSDTLASTGFDAAPYVSTGAVLALAGAVLILFARRRQTS